MLRHRFTPIALLRRAAAVLCIASLAACSGCAGDDLSDVAFEDGKGTSAVVLPQLSPPGEAIEKSTDADFVVDVSIQGAEAGREVELQVPDGEDWKTEHTAETALRVGRR